MAQTLKTVKLDVSAEQSFVYLKCKQYDSNSRIYQVILTDQNKPITSLLGNELITATMLRADGKSVDTVCQWENGNLYLNMTDGMLAVAGDGILEIRVYDTSNTEVISTMLAHVNVQKSALPYDRMIKSDEFNVLNNLILSVMNMAETAEEVNKLVEKIKADIAAYEADYGELSQEARNLINELTLFLENAETQEEQRITNENQRIINENQRIANENARNQAEQKRESDTAAAITNANHAVNTAITNLNNITNEAITNVNNEVTAALANMNEEVDNALADINITKEQTIAAADNANIATENANHAAASLNQLNANITNEEAIRIANEKQRIANEEVREKQEAIRETNTAKVIEATEEAIINAETATENANHAIARANAVSDDLIEKRENGFFKGEPGKDGVIFTLSGQFGLQVEGDDLILYYTDSDTPPNMSIDDEGYLVWDIE